MAPKTTQTDRRLEHALGRIRTQRKLILPAWDAVSVALGVVATRGLVGEDGVPVRTPALVLLATLLVTGTIVGLYRGRWTVASFTEVRMLAACYVVASAAVLVVSRVDEIEMDAFIALLGLLGFTASAAGRAVWRVWYEQNQRPENGRRVLVVVDGENGVQLIRAMLLDKQGSYLPVGIIDDDPMHTKRSVMGVPVSGTTDDVVQVAARLGAEAVVVGAPHLPVAILNKIVVESRGASCEVLIVPPLGPSDDPAGSAEGIRPLTELDLLQRREISADWNAIASYLRGRRVLVTGAGGSIGSELCRQIHKAAPALLVKLDRDESALQATQMSIEGHGLLTDPTLVVADIRDGGRMFEIFRQYRPEIVFHAAALKHLTLLEMHPSEAVKTNVEGTQKVIAACADVGVECFVNVSTDKAADPSSVLGYSKRIGERMTASYAQTVSSGKYVSVRFGNVIGSRGSVIHAFRAQAANGTAITVTHPDVTRFFMTVEEAVLLVIQAGGIGETGEALILDMGDPVRIDDMARRVAASVTPPVDVVYTGLRPGEKLHEKLFGQGESDHRPRHPLVSHVAVPPIAISSLESLRHGGADEIRSHLAALAWEGPHSANVISSVGDPEDSRTARPPQPGRGRNETATG